MPNRLPYGDKKYYYNIHCNRQRADGNEPLSYYGFILRLRKGMNVHDAIYTPAVKRNRRGEYKSTPEDNTRRRQKLNEENVMILDFDEIDELEQKQKIEPIAREQYKRWRLNQIGFLVDVAVEEILNGKKIEENGKESDN